MTDESEIQHTAALLRAAPIDRFVKALAELDQKPKVAEVIAIKNLIRDRLAELKPLRRLNVTRIFCQPFEDMLRDQVLEQSTWIPRAAIAPCWRIVEGLVRPQTLMEIKRKIEKVTENDYIFMPTLGTLLWSEASKALGNVAAMARQGNVGALDLLGNDKKIIDYAEVMAAACQVAPALEELKNIFPERPFKGLQLADREQLRTELQRISAAQQHDIRCVIHIVAHWTGNPAEIFELCVNLDLGKATPLGRVLLAQREKVVVGLLEEQVKQLKTNLDAGGDFDLASCAELARVAADSIGSALDLIKDRRAPGADSGISHLKKELGSMIQNRVLGAATRALDSVWKNGKNRNGEIADHDAVIAAEAAARAMRKCGQVASKLGIEAAIASKVTASLEAVRDEVTGQIADLGKGCEQEQLKSAQSTLANATRIMEILEGPERAFEFFREKRAVIRATAAA